MKKIKILGIIALIAIIGFTMAGCGDPPGGDPGGDPGFSISGSFTGSQSDLAQFNLTTAAVPASSRIRTARSVTTESITLSGELVDGDIVFRLTGTYDANARTYTASAAASIVRYSINGAFDEAGASLGSIATLTVRMNPSDPDSWHSISYAVTMSDSIIPISGDANTDEVSGIPAFAYGVWIYDAEASGGSGGELPGGGDGGGEHAPVTTYTYEETLLLSEWTIISDQVDIWDDGETSNRNFKSVKLTVAEIEDKGTHWDIIVAFPQYNPTKEQAFAAAAAFLQSRGLNGTQLDESPKERNYEWYLAQTTGTLYWWEDGFIHWLAFDNWDIIGQWYMTNYIDQYMISINAEPTSMFMKIKVTFEMSNTVMLLDYYATEFEMFSLDISTVRDWNTSIGDSIQFIR